jgi:hypothetical protein
MTGETQTRRDQEEYIRACGDHVYWLYTTRSSYASEVHARFSSIDIDGYPAHQLFCLVTQLSCRLESLDGHLQQNSNRISAIVSCVEYTKKELENAQNLARQTHSQELAGLAF